MVFYSLQAGLYEDATTLATECLDLVNKELERTNDPNVEKVDLQSKEKALIQLMHLHGHLAEIETTVYRYIEIQLKSNVLECSEEFQKHFFERNIYSSKLTWLFWSIIQNQDNFYIGYVILLTPPPRLNTQLFWAFLLIQI